MLLPRAYEFQHDTIASVISILAYSEEEAYTELNKLILEPKNWKLK